VLWNHVESVGTKGYTRTEMQRLLAPPLAGCSIRCLSGLRLHSPGIGLVGTVKLSP